MVREAEEKEDSLLAAKDVSRRTQKEKEWSPHRSCQEIGGTDYWL